mgnify:CR=1 FL=1
MRLIDADELLKTSFRISGKIGDKYPFEAIAISEIEAAPTVDAVPVVRCENCKHHKHNELFETHVCKFKKHRIKPYDYCSYGERREEE